VWETIERTTKVGDYDAVEIFGVIRKLGEADQLLLVLQYRPPVGKLTLELPAGLIDQGETPAEAALRELKEETGYVGQIVKISPPLVIEPGLTNASSGLVHVTIDADLAENQHPKQELDETEFIEVLRVPLHNLLAHLTDLATRRQCLIDAKLYTLALGLSFTSQ
jgi:8-oxo-dGTP pyrophosphatase MutT (NUDIX family)